VDSTSYEEVTQRVTEWARRAESRYVCLATVNNVMEGFDRPEVLEASNSADIVTPDGMPLVWGLRALGARDATRVYGPDLTPCVLAAAERAGLPVGFHGGAPETLAILLQRIRQDYPRLDIRYAVSPPFRPLSPEEDQAELRAINASGCRILFVGLNSPKQDLWMLHRRGAVGSVMLGVGAAFDFLAGTKRQAPRWMMRVGLEWFFRLCSEPRRLWRRYLRHNPRFVLLFALQLAGWSAGRAVRHAG
jgi:N-acetylglucosaminyldiphosphoundecaprenol N-acetyl-beta-D-mannosaminyltransferase